MRRSLRASEEGLRRVEAARIKKKWNKQDDAWWGLAGVAKETLKRFRNGEAIDKEKFKAICEAVGVNYQEVVGFSRCFWGTSPDVDFFCGRKEELNTLTQWIIKDKCRLISITAMGGMGKSYLAKKLAVSLETKFAGVYWVSLQNARLIEEVIEELIKFLSNQQEIEISNSFERCFSRLLDYLTEKRWLIIFDNVESILESNYFAGKYRSGYENYSELFTQLGSCSHNSSIVITTREQLPEIKRLAGEATPVRILELKGIDDSAVGILRRKGIKAEELLLKQLIEQYQGNPLALELAAATIGQTFQGDVTAFFNTNAFVFDDIQHLLDTQFQRLSSEEQSLMYWLAIYREPVEIKQIESDLISPLATRKIISTLNSLSDRSLIQVNQTAYNLQNVVLEYVSELIINTAVEEITTGKFKLLDTHSVIQATAADYIRICQYQAILKPILDAFKKLPAKELANRLLKTIVILRHTSSDLKYGYAPGNIINFLVGLQIDLTGADFSGLTIRQAYLQGIPLAQVNFSHCHFQQCLFSHALGSVLTVTFSPDQTLLATGGTDGYLRIWGVADGQEIAAWKAHNDWIRVLTFSFDGELIASGGNDKIIYVWHWKTQELQKTLSGHTDWIWSLKFAKKDNLDLLISTSSDHTARVWNLKTETTIYTYDNLPELAGVVWSVAFSPDQQTFATGSATKVQLWNINTREWIRDIPDRATRVRALCFSPDGKLLAGSNDQQQIVVWKVATGECIDTLDVPSTAAIWSLQYTPDAAKLISCGTDTIQLWDMNLSEPLITLRQPNHRVRSLAYSEQRNLLAVGSDDQMIRIWDTEKGQSVRTLSSHINRIWTLAIGQFDSSIILASGSDDGLIRLWDGVTGELIHTLSGHQGRVRCLDFSFDGKLLVSASNDRTFRVWDIETLKDCQIYRKHTDWVSKVIFLNRSQSLITISDDKSILHFHLLTGKTELFPLSQQEWIWTATVNPQEEILALAGDGLTIDLWSIKTKEKITSLRGHQQRIKAISFNHDGKFLISVSDDSTIKVWDIQKQTCIKTIVNSLRETRCLMVIPKTEQRQDVIASAGDDCLIRMHNLKTDEMTVLEGHTDSIWSLTHIKNLDRLYSCGEDETIRFWSLATGECLQCLNLTKLYEKMNLTGATGLTEMTKQSLFNLGAEL